MNSSPRTHSSSQAIRRVLAAAALCAAVASLANAATAAAGEGATAEAAATVAAHWQQQKVEFSYTGFTTHYSCDGIEEKVKRILLHFGARADLKVRATGCDIGMQRVGPFAWVHAEFNTLAPGAAAAAGDTVNARWQPLKLAARRPMFMEEGECELVEQLKPVLEKNFALRDLDVRTTCIAHQVSMNDYNVTAQALKADAVPAKG
jgi:hypothetical protein